MEPVGGGVASAPVAFPPPPSLRACNIMLAHDAVDRRKLEFFKQKFGASLEQLYIFLIICFLLKDNMNRLC